MPSGSELGARQEKAKKFWEYKAKRYPLPFEERSLKTTKKIIDIVKGRRVVIENARILDIGCGTGNYTLPLAQEAWAVIGVDFSESMISRLTEELKKHHFHNVSTLCASWKDLDITSSNFEKAFDIVWSSMSMAVREEEDVRKMEACSRNWCVYIGWGGKKKNPLMEEIFKIHDIAFQPPAATNNISAILNQIGRSHSLDFIETSWDWCGTCDEAVEDISVHIEFFGGTPITEKIKDVVSKYSQDGLLKHTTDAKLGIITWQVKDL